MNNYLTSNKMQTMSKKYWYTLAWELHYENIELKRMLQVAAEDSFQSDVVDTEMLPLELENNPYIGEKEYKADWIDDLILDWKERNKND